jgi:hypothetical protein
MNNKNFIILSVVIVGLVIIYKNLKSEPQTTSRTPAAIQKESLKEIKAEVVQNNKPAQVLKSGKIYDLDFSRFDKSEFNAEQIKDQLVQQGWHNVFVQKDPKYGFRIHVEGANVNPEIVLSEMKNNWEINQGEILNNLNGREIELTAEDQAAISELRAQMPNL